MQCAMRSRDFLLFYRTRYTRHFTVAQYSRRQKPRKKVSNLKNTHIDQHQKDCWWDKAKFKSTQIKWTKKHSKCLFFFLVSNVFLLISLTIGNRVDCKTLDHQLTVAESKKKTKNNFQWNETQKNETTIFFSFRQ